MTSYFNSLWFYDNGLMKLNFRETELQGKSIFYTITNCFLNKTEKNKLIMDSVGISGQLLAPPCSANVVPTITYFAKHAPYFINEIKIWPHYLSPCDAIYIGYLQKRWWAYPLLPFLYLIFLYMALTHYEVRPNLWRWMLAGYPRRTKVRKTENEILYWMSLQLPKSFKFIHWTAKTIVPLLKRKFGEDYLDTMMQLHYRDPEHPNRNYNSNDRDE